MNIFPDFEEKIPLSYDMAKRIARKNAMTLAKEITLGQDIFKGVNANIICYMVFNEQRMDYDTYCEWIGGDTASMSQDMVSQLFFIAKPGQRASLEGLEVELVEYAPVGDFWYVRQVNE